LAEDLLHLTARPFITRISQVEDCSEDSRGYC
jgi:hypothetical protein